MIRLKEYFNLFKKSRTTGEWGESLAANYLKRKGYRLKAKNWRSGRGELDLVMMDGEVAVIVEVRTRKIGFWVDPYSSISRHKRKIIRRTAKAWVKGRKPQPQVVRFDVVGIEYESRELYEIYHYENVGCFGKDWVP